MSADAAVARRDADPRAEGNPMLRTYRLTLDEIRCLSPMSRPDYNDTLQIWLEASWTSLGNKKLTPPPDQPTAVLGPAPLGSRDTDPLTVHFGHGYVVNLHEGAAKADWSITFTVDDDDPAWEIRLSLTNDRGIDDPTWMYRLMVFVLATALTSTAPAATGREDVWGTVGLVLRRELPQVWATAVGWLLGDQPPCVGIVLDHRATYSPTALREEDTQLTWTGTEAVHVNDGCRTPSYQVTATLADVTPPSFGDPPPRVKGESWEPARRGRDLWLGRWWDQPAPHAGWAEITRSTVDAAGFRVHVVETVPSEGVLGDKEATIIDHVYDPVLESTTRRIHYNGQLVYAERGILGKVSGSELWGDLHVKAVDARAAGIHVASFSPLAPVVLKLAERTSNPPLGALNPGLLRPPAPSSKAFDKSMIDTIEKTLAQDGGESLALASLVGDGATLVLDDEISLRLYDYVVVRADGEVEVYTRLVYERESTLAASHAWFWLDHNKPLN